MNPKSERRALQAMIALLALLPLSAGLVGVMRGPGFLDASAPWPADLDSHVRFLSGVFLAMAATYYWCLPQIERRTTIFRMLAGFTFIGGLARLGSLVVAGAPSTVHLIGLGMELVVVPLLVAWQARIARLCGRSGG
jgi:hypothetical protein